MGVIEAGDRRADPLLKEAAAVLVAHGEKTGKRSFKDRIAMVRSGGSVVLDQRKAAEFILAAGEDLGDYQSRSKLGWSLKLLQ